MQYLENTNPTHVPASYKKIFFSASEIQPSTGLYDVIVCTKQDDISEILTLYMKCTLCFC